MELQLRFLANLSDLAEQSIRAYFEKQRINPSVCDDLEDFTEKFSAITKEVGWEPIYADFFEEMSKECNGDSGKEIFELIVRRVNYYKKV